MTAEIEVSCPSCRSGLLLEGPPWQETTDCECGGRVSIRPSGVLGECRAIDRCPVCDADLFYVQKDFNRAIGCSIVAIGAILFLALPMPWGLVAMGATALFDFVLFLLLPWVTVCYRCRSIFRGFPRNPEHKSFDLNVAEQFAR